MREVLAPTKIFSLVEFEIGSVAIEQDVGDFTINPPCSEAELIVALVDANEMVPDP